jgi:predicted hydrocarbon binding protein
MTHAFDLRNNGMVALTRDSLAALQAALFRDLGANAATYLQESGYAGGSALFAAFSAWLALRGDSSVESLPANEFATYATAFFEDAGWGSLEMGTLREFLATIDSADWAEADPQIGLEFPGCHLTTGVFADFFGRIAGAPVAVMEVECRSMGAERCRFLLGSGDVMQRLYDEMAGGATYEAAADALAAT